MFDKVMTVATESYLLALFWKMHQQTSS